MAFRARLTIGTAMLNIVFRGILRSPCGREESMGQRAHWKKKTSDPRRQTSD
jgi:hypothetical protein